jgi:hypothetical protein
MKAQLEVVGRHLDEHKYLRHMDDKEKALESFINDYGWVIREMYCTRICSVREGCEIASQMSSSGDLLRNHNKKELL